MHSAGTDFNKAVIARNSLVKRIGISVKEQVEKIKAEKQQSGDMSVINDAVEEDVEMEQMTEEDLLRGLEGMPPAESPGSQRNGY